MEDLLIDWQLAIVSPPLWAPVALLAKERWEMGLRY